MVESSTLAIFNQHATCPLIRKSIILLRRFSPEQLIFPIVLILQEEEFKKKKIRNFLGMINRFMDFSNFVSNRSSSEKICRNISIFNRSRYKSTELTRAPMRWEIGLLGNWRGNRENANRLLIVLTCNQCFFSQSRRVHAQVKAIIQLQLSRRAFRWGVNWGFILQSSLCRLSVPTLQNYLWEEFSAGIICVAIKILWQPRAMQS